MAGLIPFPLEQPGVAGLNKEGRNTVLGPEWATKITNLVIDDEGRLSLRKGTKALAATVLDGDVQVSWSLRTGAGGVQRYCATAAGSIYELIGSTWTSVESGLPDGNVQFANVDGIAHYVHAGVTKARRQASSGTAFAQIALSPGACTACVGLYGRLWLLTADAVYVSANVLITNAAYTLTINLGYAFGEGGDEGVAIAEFNGRVVLFGKNNTVIYDNAEDPLSSGEDFQKVETIGGVGCLYRDSVQNVGKDILFLSNLGMRTLGRVIQEKSNPITDAAPQVRDYILDNSVTANEIAVKSAFSAKLGLYVLTISDSTLVFDTRRPLSNGALRVVEWDADFNAPGYDSANGLILCRGIVPYQYTGALDGVTSGGTGGAPFEGDFEGGWLDFGQIAEGAGALIKYLKKIHMTFVGGNGATLTFKWTTDFSTAFRTSNVTIPTPSGGSFFGGTAFFGGGSTFGSSVVIANKTKNASRSGRVVKVGFTIQNSTSTFSVNRMDVFAKIGRLSTT